MRRCVWEAGKFEDCCGDELVLVVTMQGGNATEGSVPKGGVVLWGEP